MDRGHEGATGSVDAHPGYRVLGELGRGADTTVLRVQRIADGASYALKTFDVTADDPVRASAGLCREAALLACVNHPGLVAVHEVGLRDGRPYVVMDLIDGRSLGQVLAAGALSADRAVKVALDLAEPLVAMHRAGLVHRDLKPDNVMVQSDGRARLIDFGLAARETDHATDAAVGTLMYCSPEQAGTLSRPVDARSDLYSFGVVLFECLTGRPPFASADVGQLLHMHAVVAPPDLCEQVPDIPPELAAIVARLLAKEPDDRYQTGTDLLTALCGIAGEPSRCPSGGGAEEPFVGQGAELGRLTRRWQSARDGAGGAVAIHGGSGCGKSRLLQQLAARAAADGAAVLHATATADETVPMAALRRAVEAHLRRAESLPAADRDAALDRIRVCAGGVAALLATLSPELSAVLGPTEPVGEDGQRRFPMAVAGFLAALARDSGGVLLVVDDVQWLDSGSRRVLIQLAAEVAEVSLLLVVSGRTGADTASFVASVGTAVDVELTPAPLTDLEVADLVAALLPGTAADDPLVRHLVARSRGNPFVVREYLRSIVDAGLLRPSWGQWRLDEGGLDALDLPQDALGLMLNRLHDLDERQASLLATAAVAGTEFRPEVVAAVHAVPVAEVLDVVHAAASRGLVEARAGGGFAFLHVGIRDALAARLDEPTTAERHAALAGAVVALPVPAEGPTAERVYAVARHYRAAGAAAPAARAGRACIDAGMLALRSYAPAEAVIFLSYALDLAHAPTAALLHPLGVALKEAGRLAEAAQRLEQAVELEPDLLRRNETILALADTYRAGWRLSDGSAIVDRGLAEMGTRLPANPFVRLVTTVAMVVAAVLMQRTGVGLGTARGDQRRRCELICALHSVGFGLCGPQARVGLMVTHSLRSVFWGNRIGHGPQYIRGQFSLGIFSSLAGLRRTAAAAFVRMNADPASAEPSLRAELVFGQTLAAYMANREPDAATHRALEEHGRWLNLPMFAEGTYTLVMDALGQGRTRDAARLWGLAERRLATAAGERTALSVVPVMLAAAQGRHADAAVAQQDLDRDPVPAGGRDGRDYYRCTSGIFALSEQLEFGAPFDEAVSAYAALEVNPMLIQRQGRITLFQVAMGRIAQYRAATGAADRSARLAQARAAIRALGRGARDDVSRSWLRIARADLLAVTGKPRRALRLLARDEAIHHPPTPLLAFEQARVRARAYLALDAPADARRQARFAADIAEDEGWPHRAGWITAEFPSTAAFADRGSTANRRSGAGTVGSAPVGWSDDRRRLRALEKLGVAASRILDPQALARAALDEIIRILRAERAFLFLTGERDDRLRPHLGRDARGSDLTELTGYSTSLVERVRVSREPLVITGTDHGAALGAQSAVQFGLRSIMIAPLLQDERLIGVVYLDSTVAKGIFTEEDAGILIALANHIANALETARSAQLEISIQTAQRQRDLADWLRAAFEAMTDTLDPAQVLDRLLHWTAALVPNDGVWLVARRDHGPVVRHLDAAGARIEEPIADDPAVMRLFAIDQPVTDPAVPADLARRRPAAAHWTMLPLRARNTDLGVLAIASAATDGEPHNETEVAAALVAQGMTAYDNASLFARVHQLATRDELTGIANRRSLFERAEQALAGARRDDLPVVAMMLDVDYFKRVNDTHGHPSGDDVIREVASRLMEHCRNTDIAGRYGGEEFVLILPGADVSDGYRIAERLRERIGGEPVLTRTGPLPVTASIGLAQATSTEDLAGVLARADEALYRAKQEGRNRTCAYADGASAEALHPA